MENFDLYNYMDNSGLNSASAVQDLVKAMNAGNESGLQLLDETTAGSSLKVESLEPAVKILTNTDKHIVFYKMLPKMKATNTVEQFNQLEDYGAGQGFFNKEGETPQFSDPEYKRRALFIKYMGVSGEVTHQAQLVNMVGNANALSLNVRNKTQELLRAINSNLMNANSDTISDEFDGFFKQHYDGLATDLDTYYNSSAVVDARGSILTDGLVEEAAHAAVNDGFGNISDVIAPPVVFSNYVKQFHESKRVVVNNPISGTTGATMGQAVNTIMTQFGSVNVTNDIFFDKKESRLYNSGATSTKAPVAVTADPATPVAVDTDTNNKFGTDYAGDYFYAVASKNRYGQSAMTLLDTNAISVASTESVDLKFSITEGAYASESFVIYRTEKDVADYTTAKFYPILTVTKAQRTAGYDGGDAGLVRDRNRVIPNTYNAVIVDNSPDVWSIKQLAPIMRMDLARTSPSYRFMILAYLTPALYAPKKMVRITNIGNTIPA